MNKVEIISLFGIETEYEDRTPPDLSLISSKSLNLNFNKLNCSNEFKYIYENSHKHLENILANRQSKKGFQKSKESLMEELYAEQKIKLEQDNKNNKKTTLKSRR